MLTNGTASRSHRMGRLEEAIAENRRAVELDPLSLIINGNLGHRLLLRTAV